MPSANTKKLIGSAAAFTVLGLLIWPAPAQARPQNECYALGGYQFAGGEVIIEYPQIGAETRFNAPRGTTVDSPAETFYDNAPSLKGRITGDIDKGGNWIRLTVTRGPKFAPLLLTGAVLPNNTPAGNLTFENHDMQLWESPTELACLPGAPPPLEEQLPKPQKMATVVGGPVDIYNIAHNETPDPATGVQGAKVGTLGDGRQVELAAGGPCARETWCKIVMPDDPAHFGFVEGHLQY
jgi:hypothetical protein